MIEKNLTFFLNHLKHQLILTSHLRPQVNLTKPIKPEKGSYPAKNLARSSPPKLSLSLWLHSCSSLSLILAFSVLSRMRYGGPFLYYSWNCSSSRKFIVVSLYGLAKPCPQRLDWISTIIFLYESRRPDVPFGAYRQGWLIEFALLGTHVPECPNFR